MKKATLAALAASILLLPQAEARSIEDIFKECGIGGLIFKNTPAAAAVSNIIWDLGTTATTSDLTGACNDKNEAKVAMFVASSYDSLETEIASGQGKYIETLAKLSGKSVSSIRKSFKNVVANKNYTTMTKLQKANALYNTVAL